MSTPQYGVNIHRIADDDVEELVDRYITADQAIDLMIHIQKNVPAAEDDEDSVEAEEEAEDESPSQRQRSPRKCGNCGGEGHTARTCKRVSLDEPPKRLATPRDPVGDNRSLRQKVKELFDAGLAIEEVQDALPSHPMVEVGAIYRDIERRQIG